MTDGKRVSELADELSITAAEVLAYARKLEIPVKNNLSKLTHLEADKIVELVKRIRSRSIEEKRVGQNVIRRRKVAVTLSRKPEELPVGPAETSREEAPAVVEEPLPVQPETATVHPQTPDEPAPPAVEMVAENADPAPASEAVSIPAVEEPPIERVVIEVPVEPVAAAPSPAVDEESEAAKAKKKKKKPKYQAEIVRTIPIEDLLGADAAARSVMRGREPEAGEDRPEAAVEATREVRFDLGGGGPSTGPAGGVPGRRREIIDNSFMERMSRSIRRKERDRPRGGAGREAPRPVRRKVKITGESIVVGELAKRMSVKVSDIIKSLMGHGVMVTTNMAIDAEIASVIVEEFGHEIELVSGFEEEDILKALEETDEGRLQLRDPVVTVMGHVDHGKTSLLDAIRSSNVAEKEHGGITQHIGAYRVKCRAGMVTFIDTPGHASFTSMRARGAQVTDIVILVVAADDGVQPQTLEAINHAREAKVPIVVAVNKVDKDNADPGRVRQELAGHGLQPEEWGGETIFVDVSAKKRTGIEELLEAVMLQAEVAELKADPAGTCHGAIVESRVDIGRGPVATAIVQSGTLKVGALLVSGTTYGRVKAMYDERSGRLDDAGPSVPVEILGLSEAVEPGEKFYVVEDERIARSVTEKRMQKRRERELAQTTKVSLENLYDRMTEAGRIELKVVVKADVQGSVEALRETLDKLETDKVVVKVIHAGIGGINDSDIMLASASDALVVGFNIRPPAAITDLAARERVNIKLYNVIFDLIDDMKLAMRGMLEPVIREEVIGHAEVRQVFQISKVGSIAGCYVTDGQIRRQAHVRLVRNSVVVTTGRISSLKRLKDDAREVQSGFECGIGIENYNDIKAGDVIEAFVRKEEAAELEFKA